MIDRQKLDNIHRLPLEDIKLIFHECEEALGLVDITTASNVLGIGKRRLYQLMNNSNAAIIGTHRFPFINLIISK